MVEIRFDIEDLLTVELIYLNHTIALYRYMFYEYYLSIYICESSNGRFGLYGLYLIWGCYHQLEKVLRKIKE